MNKTLCLRAQCHPQSDSITSSYLGSYVILYVQSMYIHHHLSTSTSKFTYLKTSAIIQCIYMGFFSWCMTFISPRNLRQVQHLQLLISIPGHLLGADGMVQRLQIPNRTSAEHSVPNVCREILVAHGASGMVDHLMFPIITLYYSILQYIIK